MTKRLILIFAVLVFAIISVGATNSKSTIYEHQFIKTSYSDEIKINKLITSKEELSKFYEEYKTKIDLEHREKVYADSTIGFIDAIEKYDEEYFKQNNLALIYFTEHSGSITHEMKEVSINDNSLNINVIKKSPEYITCDMAGWLLILEIEKGLNVTDIIIKMKG